MQLWMRSCNCVVGWFHPEPSRKQCHCTHPGCLFAVATWMNLPENTGVFTWEKLPNREVNMYWSRWRTHMPTHSSCGVKHMETTGQSCWIKQCEFIDVLATNTKTTLMNGWTWQLLYEAKGSFGQLRYEAKICCRAWKNRRFWLLYMPNLKTK